MIFGQLQSVLLILTFFVIIVATLFTDLRVGLLDGLAHLVDFLAGVVPGLLDAFVNLLAGPLRRPLFFLLAAADDRGQCDGRKHSDKCFHELSS